MHTRPESSRDPLAGQRAAINNGTVDALVFVYFEPGTTRRRP